MNYAEAMQGSEAERREQAVFRRIEFLEKRIERLERLAILLEARHNSEQSDG